DQARSVKRSRKRLVRSEKTGTKQSNVCPNRIIKKRAPARFFNLPHSTECSMLFCCANHATLLFLRRNKMPAVIRVLFRKFQRYSQINPGGPERLNNSRPCLFHNGIFEILQKPTQISGKYCCVLKNKIHFYF